MKAKAILSAITGFFFGLITFFVLRYIDETDAFLLAVISGLLFYLVLFIFLIIHERIMNKKYAEFEKKITSPVFHKTNGNFKLYNGKIKNANIYFCEDGITLVSLDEKPYVNSEKDGFFVCKKIFQEILKTHPPKNALLFQTSEGVNSEPRKRKPFTCTLTTE